MKKMIFFTALALVAVVGSICYNNENEISDMVKANIKALADNETTEACEKSRGDECYEVVVLSSNSGVLVIPDYKNKTQIID